VDQTVPTVGRRKGRIRTVDGNHRSLARDPSREHITRPGTSHGEDDREDACVSIRTRRYRTEDHQTAERARCAHRQIEPLVAALERRRLHGAYHGLQDRATFAGVLTDDLRMASGDGHLSVKLGTGERPGVEGADDWERSERRRAIHANHGFASAQVLSDNVGYLRIAEFMEPQASLETATATMRFVANTRALIFDLRGNPGGYAGIPEYLATYLFAEGPPVLLSTFEYRPEKAAPDKTYILPAVMGRRRAGTLALVLVDRKTASAAEWFAYTLQAFQKARVVGESSAGGASSNEYFELDGELRRSISTGVPVSAPTGTN
jgi:retinol-binding protein 3